MSSLSVVKAPERINKEQIDSGFAEFFFSRSRVVSLVAMVLAFCTLTLWLVVGLATEYPMRGWAVAFLFAVVLPSLALGAWWVAKKPNAPHQKLYIGLAAVTTVLLVSKAVDQMLMEGTAWLIEMPLLALTYIYFYSPLRMRVTFVLAALLTLAMCLPPILTGAEKGLIAEVCVMVLSFNLAGVVARHHWDKQLKREYILIRNIEERSNRDQLTGLFNRNAFKDSFNALKARRRDSIIGITVFDVDRFKLVNDHLGHAEGDHLLKDIASSLNTACLSGHECAARLGGDEFVLMLSVGNKEELEQRVVGAVSAIRTKCQKFRTPQGCPDISFSTVPMGWKQDASLDEMIHAADMGMYAHKNSRR
ncbi:MAG: diguanylate cyclase [Gammaproteobacteria bacterium]|nr:diguanylate cyclase [Gammaproteobacteria bacterium]